jgi:Asp-tRNA(Asn)/Glu-tRNA(Gln) amidotransferase A subunit family amidase
MPNALSATEAARKIREGKLTSVDLVKACLKRIEDTDGQLHAWAYLNPEFALTQAAELDQVRLNGRPLGPLHGVPVGLKDIIDTKDMPTERGTAIFKGRQPDADAGIVERLQEAGAVILGKTATTEFAFMHPTNTRNPHNVDHTPGGSSSGSAAAVAAFHIPLAIGTQTNGSVIRPASYCGTYGFKPTRGVIPRRGVLQTSNSLDQVGVFARTLQDAALLTDAIGFYDPSDPKSYARPRPNMGEGYAAEAPVNPNFIYLDMPYHNQMASDTVAGFDDIITLLGGQVERIEASPNLVDLIAVQHVIHEYEIIQHLGTVFTKHWDGLSTSLQPVLERARKISEAQYQDALAVMQSAETFFEMFFRDYDAVLAPSAAGEAPLFSDGGTGDPIFSTVWTLAGLPCLTIPLMVGGNGLPVGVQLIGAAQEDDRLFRTANWMLKKLETA